MSDICTINLKPQVATISEYDSFIKYTNKFLMAPNNKAKYGGSFKTVLGKEVYIKQVLYNAPATIVWWSDGTQTKDICPKSCEYNPDSGLAFCVLKKLMGSGEVGKLFNDWEMPNVDDKEMKRYISLSDVRAKHRK